MKSLRTISFIEHGQPSRLCLALPESVLVAGIYANISSEVKCGVLQLAAIRYRYPAGYAEYSPSKTLSRYLHTVLHITCIDHDFMFSSTPRKWRCKLVFLSGGGKTAPSRIRPRCSFPGSSSKASEKDGLQRETTRSTTPPAPSRASISTPYVPQYDPTPRWLNS